MTSTVQSRQPISSQSWQPHRHAFTAAVALMVYALGPLGAGCSVTGSARVERPEGARRPRGSHLVVSRPLQDAHGGLPKSAFESEAALVRVDAELLCADIIVRTWRGAGSHWDIGFETDRHELSPVRLELLDCNPDNACLPIDSELRSRATDRHLGVKVHGGRVCIRGARLPVGKAKWLRLNVSQGAYTLEFTWQLV